MGPVVEESLLSLLCALGVLHSPENQLLVLPCDSESLRRVTLRTFIGSKDDGLESKKNNQTNADASNGGAGGAAGGK